MNSRTWASGSAPVKPGANCPCQATSTVGMDCACAAAASCGFASTSTVPSTHAPPSAATSLSRIGVSCLHGAHQPAQKSRTTGTVIERATTSVSKFASVTSTTVVDSAPPLASALATSPALACSACCCT